MRRDQVELVATGLLAATLLASTAVVLSADGDVDGGTPVAAVAHATPSAPTSLAETGVEEYGRMLFLTKGCSGCHALAGAPNTLEIGPRLTDLARVAATRRPGTSAEDYVRESILEPQAFLTPGYGTHPDEQMPQLRVDPAERDVLVGFLLSPRPRATATPRPPPTATPR